MSGLPSGLVEWLASGERGTSSNTMVTHLFGIDAMGAYGWASHPHDPDDLRRCRMLMLRVPQIAAELPRMATCSPAWAALVAHWEELCASMDAECPKWGGRAPKTYARMRELISGAERRGSDTEAQPRKVTA